METEILRPLAYSIAQAEVVSDLSRATLYRLMAKGQLETVTVGGRRLITRQALEKLLHLQRGSSPSQAA